MEQLGTDFNATGSVMSKIQLQELRKKRGECVICGRKCFHKKLFKMIPINDHGRVLNGRCLGCNPLDVKDTDDGSMPAVSRPATQEEQKRFSRSQSNLTHGGRGGSMRRGSSNMSISAPVPERSVVSDGVVSRALSSQSTHSTPPRASSNSDQSGESGGIVLPPQFGMISPATSHGRETSAGSQDNMYNRDTSQNSQDMNNMNSRRASNGSEDMGSREASHRSLPRQRNLDDSGGGQPPTPVQRQSIDHSRISGQTETRSVSGSSLLSLMSTDSAFTHDSPHESIEEGEDPEEYDDYTPLPLEDRPSGEQLEDALERITGHNIDEEEAFALASAGASAHPSAVALLEYYRRTFRESQRSLRSTNSNSMGDSSHGEDTGPAHGILNRGGAVSFSSLGGPSTSRRLYSDRQNSGRQQSGRSMNGRQSNDQSLAIPRRQPSEQSVTGRQIGSSDQPLAIPRRQPSEQNVYDRQIGSSDQPLAIPRRQPSERGVYGRQIGSSSHHIDRQIGSSSHNIDRQINSSSHHQDRQLSSSNHQQGSQRSMGSHQLRTGSARSLGSSESFEEDHYQETNTQERMNSGHSSDMPFNAQDPERPRLDAHFSQYGGDDGLDLSVHSAGDGDAGMRSMMNQSNYGSSQGLDSSSHSDGGGARNSMRSIDPSFGMRPPMNRTQRSGSDLDISAHSVGGGGASNSIRSQYSDRSLLDAPQSHRMTIAQPSLEEQGLIQIKAAGAAYEEILSIMRDFPGSPAVQTTGLQEISNLNLSPQDSDILAQIGAIQVIVAAMQSYPMDMELQICGCRAMWNVSGTNENQLAFVEAGGLGVILNNMDGYLDFAEVQEQALAALGNLGAVEVNLQKIIEVGTVGRIVEAMNKHSDNVEVQMKGCTAITNLASHVTPLKKSIMEAGGGGAVVISMVMHPSDPALQEKALRAMRNLSAQCEENKLELANIGGIDAVVTAMQVHRDISGIQEAGAWVLSNMAGNADVKVLIGDCGGIDVIIRAMWVHSDSSTVQEWSCRALYTLSLDRNNSSMVLQVGGISAVVNAMQAHSDSSVVQEMGCAILCNLAVDQACKMRVVDEEALDAIVLAMVLHGESFKVQECACQVLLQLAIMENFKAMQASNIGELVTVAAERFPQNCDEPARRLLYVLEGFAADYTG
jgi:hypothetical protein